MQQVSQTLNFINFIFKVNLSKYLKYQSWIQIIVIKLQSTTNITRTTALSFPVIYTYMNKIKIWYQASKNSPLINLFCILNKWFCNTMSYQLSTNPLFILYSQEQYWYNTCNGISGWTMKVMNVFLFLEISN